MLRSRKVGVTTDNVIDALRGIPFLNIQNKRDFYQLLKSNFISRREEITLFDELFEQFWSFEDKIVPSAKELIQEEGETSKEKDKMHSFKILREEQSFLKESNEGEEKKISMGDEEIPGYSPEEILGRKDFGHLEKGELERVKDFVLTLSRKMAMNLSRRWKKGREDQLDFRRSIRKSIKYGGEMVELRRRQRKQKPLRIILLCDVSGSMDIYSQFFLLFMYGLQNHYPYCETFGFSTRLSHISSLLKRKSFEETLRLLSAKVLDWSGGTNIGGALHQLHQRHAHLLHPNRTLFLIFSDGWDRGDTALLNSEMKYLKKQVKKIVWINPLLGSPSYQPICKGMSVALPYLDHFLPCHNFMSLKKLSSHISKI